MSGGAWGQLDSDREAVLLRLSPGDAELVLRSLTGVGAGDADSLRARLDEQVRLQMGRASDRRGFEFAILRGLTPAAAVDGPAGRLFLFTGDAAIGRSVYVKGGYQERKIGEALRILAKERIDVTGTTILDIGANTGITTVPALTRFGFAASVAVEPSPHNLALLRATVTSNGLDDRVRIVHGAAASRAGTVELELSPSDSGDHRVRTTSEPGSSGEQDRATITVDAVPISDLDLTGLAELGLLWCDTQGFEGHVLAGGVERIRGIPAVFEYWPYGLRRAGNLELLHELVARLFSRVMDLRRMEWVSAAEIGAFESRYAGSSHTDVIALP